MQCDTVMCVCACCRWPGTVLPVVKFVNGREEVLVPESFTADVAAVGICKRLQVQHTTSGSCLSLHQMDNTGDFLLIANILESLLVDCARDLGRGHPRLHALVQTCTCHPPVGCC